MLLVEVQHGLTHLTRGRLLRQELEAEIAARRLENSIGVTSAANSIFEELQRKIKKQIPNNEADPLDRTNCRLNN